MGLLFTDAIFQEHVTGNHPESPARLESVRRALDASRIADRWTIEKPTPADDQTLRLVHASDYIAAVGEFAANGGGRIEGDTVVSRRSDEVARHAAGAAVAAVDAVIQGTHSISSCLIRPPGHHALPHSAMGFCLFNNVAVAAAHAVRRLGLSRVLIVDWDVHHGNGTQDMFYDSAEVFFLSVHRWPFYPGTGTAEETGRGDGLGTTFNLPLEFGISRAEYRERFHTILDDVAKKCQPELILISAGFDAHAADPIGSLGLETEDFQHLTQLAMDAANQFCDGKLVSLLEGGYNVDALAESVSCHLETLGPL